jgi:antibiotic biosynthesis monooxygenase (ABM) superfamily enzyme
MSRPLPPTAPPRYKVALLTWLGAYPVITVALGVLGPVTARWPLPLRTLLISGLMVVALTWGVLPALGYVLRGWLRRKSVGTEP